MAAFHDISLSMRASDAVRVSPRADERSLNRETLLLSLYRRPRKSRVVIPGRALARTRNLAPRQLRIPGSSLRDAPE
jgi:hypothetical protein